MTAVSQDDLMRNEPWWLSEATLEAARDHGLKDQEYQGILELLGRPLSMLELGIFSALYSEHCSYKSSKVHLKTLPTEGPRVIQGPGENAGVVDIGDGKAVVFKIESHNHPSFIEPFQGAATGVGGILRDVFTMGARPIANLNALRFGDVEHPRTPYLLKRAVAGIGTYGNCVGVPTVGGELYFHPAYNGNCLVNAFTLGVVDHDKVFYGHASGVGNAVFYVGSKTGRDGIHGATMASETFEEGAEEKRPTVQVGDPFQEKLLIEACLEVMKTDAVVGIQDMGAAGMTSSSFEMAERAGCGVEIHLDRVPQREEGMNPYEIMLSESQERMLVVVKRGHEEEVTRIFRHWELDAVEIGEVIEGSDVKLYWHGELVSSIAAPLVTSAVPQYEWPVSEPPSFHLNQQVPPTEVPESNEPLDAVWLSLLGSANLCSRHPVYSQYDSTVRNNTVVHPGGDAAVVRVKGSGGSGKPEKGIALSLDCNSRYCALAPRQGAALAVAEAVRNITAVGGEPIGISNCLNFGNPERPESMWQISEGIRGLGEAAREFSVPVVSGNVSLYNETMGTPILPTPQIAMVGLLEDASFAVTAHFKCEGDIVLVVGEASPQGLLASEYAASIVGFDGGMPPELDYERERRTNEAIRELIGGQLLRSCHDISSGGLAIALAECCFATERRMGVTLGVESESERDDVVLFSESHARFIVSTSPEKAAKVRTMIEAAGLSISLSGTVGGDIIEVDGVAAIEVQDAYSRWFSGLEQNVLARELAVVQ